jgi:hypothetical protein
MPYETPQNFYRERNEKKAKMLQENVIYLNSLVF